MNLNIITIEDRNKIKPFIDWLVDNELVDSSQIYNQMNNYLNWLQKGREEVIKYNNVDGDLSNEE